MNERNQPSLHINHAAIFVDYENLHHVISAQHPGDRYPDEYAAEILDKLRTYLRDNDDTHTTIARAYADFGTLDGDGQYIQRSLHLDGIEPRYVSTSLQKNAAELQLCVEAVDVLHDRPDIHTVVIVAGNRTYLPLVRRLTEQGHRVFIAPLFPPSADDMPRFAEDEVFLDARNLLSEASCNELLNGSYDHAASGDEDVPYRKNKPSPEDYEPITNPMARRTIEITEEHFGQYDEVYLTPLLRKLSDILGPEHDPKSLISELEATGAVRLEKRNGYPYDYTVLIVHDDHPDVQDIQEAYYRDLSYENGHPGEHEAAEEYDAPASPEFDGTPEAATDTAYEDFDEYDADTYEDDWDREESAS